MTWEYTMNLTSHDGVSFRAKVEIDKGALRKLVLSRLSGRARKSKTGKAMAARRAIVVTVLSDSATGG